MSLLQAMGEKDVLLELGDLMDLSAGRNFPGCSLPANDEERNTAKEATAKFFDRSFKEAHGLVVTLAETRPNDPKVAINVLASSFCSRHCTNGQDFVKELMETCETLKINLTIPESLEDMDYAAFYFNKALVSFHLRQYRGAVKVLRKLFQYVEPLEDRLIVKVSFLLIECYLALQQPENALHTLNHMESNLLEKNSCTSLQQSPTLPVAGSGSTKNSSPEKDPNVKTEGSTKTPGKSLELVLSERQKQKFQEYRIRSYLMSRNLRSCKKEAKGFLNATCSGASAIAQPFLKANVEYLKGNWRKAVYFLNTLPNIASEEAVAVTASAQTGSFPALLGGSPDAPDAPTLPEGPWSESLGMAYYNNLGCVHFHMGRWSLACHYFTMAAKENDRLMKARQAALRLAADLGGGGGGDEGEDKDKDKALMGTESWPVWAQGCSRKYELAYNMGISALHAGKPELAFEHLLIAAQAFPRNPLLWLRLAEACIMNYKADNEPDFHFQDRKKSLVQGSVGPGSHRKLLLPTQLSQCGPGRGDDSIPASTPMLRLEFADVCLKNALTLINRRDDPSQALAPITPATSGGAAGIQSMKDGKKEQQNAEPEEPDGNALKPKTVETWPGPTFKPREGFNLRCSILVAGAFVCLRLHNPRLALKYTKELLQCEPYLSVTHRLLTHSYAAEALVMEDRISEAIPHLVADDVGSEFDSNLHGMSPFQDAPDAGGNNHVANQGTKHTRRWFPNNASTAKVVVQYNLTVAYAFRGELEKAGDALKQLSKFKEPNTEIPIQAMLLALYIQVQMGHTDIARKIIKQHCPQYR